MMIMKVLRNKGTFQIGSMGMRNCSDTLLINQHALWVIFRSRFWSNSRVIFFCLLLTLGGPLQSQCEEHMSKEGI